MISPFPSFFRVVTPPVVHTFKLEITGSGSFTLPLVSSGTYDMVVDWGDGSPTSTVTAYNDSDRIHTYETSGPFELSMTGTCTKFIFAYTDANRLKVTKLIDIVDMGFVNDTAGPICFSKCTNLTSVVPFCNFANVTELWKTFDQCTGLTTIPEDLFRYNPQLTKITNIFNNGGLTTIPTDLFRYNTEVVSFNGVFMRVPVTAIPATLFDACTKVNALGYQGFAYAFYDCNSLSGAAPALWSRDPQPTGNSCFTYCTGLSNYASIPAVWKEE